MFTNSSNHRRWTPAVVGIIIVTIIAGLLLVAKARTAQGAEIPEGPHVCGVLKEYGFSTDGKMPWEMSFTFFPDSVVKMRSMVEVRLRAGNRYKIFYRDTVIEGQNRRYFQGFTPVSQCVKLEQFPQA